MIRRGLAMLAGAAAMLQPAFSAAAIELRTTPVWGGAATAGHVTEIAVTIVTESDMSAVLIASSPLASVEQALSLEADTPMQVSVPVRVDAGGIVALKVSGGNDTGLREIALSLRQAGLTVASRSSDRLDRAIAVGVDDFPRLPQAFEGIRTVVLDVATFDALDTPQQTALAGFAADCGRIVFIGQAPLPPPLQNAAGCGGRYLAVAPSDRELADTFARLGDAQPMPGASALARLIATDGWVRSWWIACIFMVVYCGLLAGLARRDARVTTLLLAIGVAFMASLLIGNRGASAAAASWSVARSGDTSRRSASLLRVSGSGRGVVDIALGAAGTLPAPVSAAEPVELKRSAGSAIISVAARLFSVSEFTTRQIQWQGSPLSLQLEDASVQVINRSGRPSTQALLNWNGEVHIVPSLAPDESWQPGPPENIVLDAAEHRLWRQQSAGYSASLLLAAQRSGTPGSERHNDWLMVLPDTVTLP